MEVIEYLKSFNRKERYHLVGQLLGNSEFKLDPNIFRKILNLLNLETPSYYFSAMDYHIDWIYASLSLANKTQLPALRDKDNLCISATQEDVDFLISFVDEKGITHLIMIEAKGDTNFTSEQISHKSERLTEIFGDNGNKWKNVVPHFIFCSPNRPTFKKKILPKFIRGENQNELLWFRLYMPANQRKVTRCDSDGKPSQNGSHWRIDDIRKLES